MLHKLSAVLTIKLVFGIVIRSFSAMKNPSSIFVCASITLVVKFRRNILYEKKIIPSVCKLFPRDLPIRNERFHVMAALQIIFRSNYQNILLKRREKLLAFFIFFLKDSSRHVNCSFDSPAENVFFRVRFFCIKVR